MTTSTPDTQPAVQHTAQVAIAGAGPVSLMMANYLGQMGISVLLIGKLDTLIGYPRTIGIDDESLQAMRAMGLVSDVLPHTTPWHIMHSLTPKGCCFADVQSMADEFGWSRRSAFTQPQVDAVMYHGLQRFLQVRCLFSREVETFSQNGDSVTSSLKGPDDERGTVRANWLVACDGGAGFIRRTLNTPLEGKTTPDQQIVIDIANDPLATSHVYLCCDPVRPCVSVVLPYGVHRFEFMVMPGETGVRLSELHNMRRPLSKVLPDSDRVELIRQRVYTHNVRLAERLHIDRVLLAGDATHIMSVWQEQGYSSNTHGAFNLAWKLTLVISSKAGGALLDNYQQGRHNHAKAMINLSVTAGNVLAPPKRWQEAMRDGLSWLLNYLPPVKRCFLEIRFKPMPQYHKGALLIDGTGRTSPVGKMLIQPQVTLENGESVLLDEIIGASFAIIGWGCNPQWGLDTGQIARWRAIGVHFIQVVPTVQIRREQDNTPGTLQVGDTQNRLRGWFAQHGTAIAVVRPDRFVAALTIPQTLDAQLTALAEKTTLTTGDTARTEEKMA